MLPVLLAELGLWVMKEINSTINAPAPAPASLFSPLFAPAPTPAPAYTDADAHAHVAARALVPSGRPFFQLNTKQSFVQLKD